MTLFNEVTNVMTINENANLVILTEARTINQLGPKLIYQFKDRP